jgi:hypothetical protein
MEVKRANDEIAKAKGQMARELEMAQVWLYQ